MQCHSFSFEYIELHKINSFLSSINQLIITSSHSNVDIQPWSQEVLFFGQNFIKFQPEKYDYDLYKRFSMKKMAQFCQILKKGFSRFSDLYNKFQYVRSQEYRRIFFFSFFFFFSYLVCSQIWLNRLIHDHHFSYLTKQEKKKRGTHREPAPTSSPCRMDGIWTKDTFSLYSCPIANHSD